MVLVGSGDHRLVSAVVYRWVDGCFCCELCVKKVWYLERTLTKKIKVRAAMLLDQRWQVGNDFERYR
jgi:hypothetical protein